MINDVAERANNPEIHQRLRSMTRDQFSEFQNTLCVKILKACVSMFEKDAYRLTFEAEQLRDQILPHKHPHKDFVYELDYSREFPNFNHLFIRQVKPASSECLKVWQVSNNSAFIACINSLHADIDLMRYFWWVQKTYQDCMENYQKLARHKYFNGDDFPSIQVFRLY